MHGAGRNEMATTVNPLKPGAAIHHHKAKAAGIRKLSFLLQHSPGKQRPSFSAPRRHDLRYEILFGQFMAAAEDFLEALTATGTLNH
jgi:hypothetical protein